MTLAAEYLPYEQLSLPLVLVEGDRVLYANLRHRLMTGLRLSELPASVESLIARSIRTTEQQGMRMLHAQVSQGKPAPEENWLTLAPTEASPQGRLMRIFRIQSGLPGRYFIIFLEAEKESTARALTESLVTAASRVLSARTENEVLEVATQALREAGYFCSSLIFEGEWVRHGPLQIDPSLLEAVEKIAGAPMQQVRFPKAALASEQLETMFVERRAIFRMDAHEVIASAYPPEILLELRRRYPVMRQLEAPLFVLGEPFGFLSINAVDLPPAVVATVELFAQMVSSGLENARQHQLARERLDQLHSLQQELVNRERLAALGEAAAVVAHEVRNPLGSILNCVTLLRQKEPSADAPSVLRMLEEEAFRLERLVGHLLDFTRPLAPERRATSLAEVARACIRALQDRGEWQEIDFRLQVQGDDTVDGDEVLLQLALENLLRNSAQVSPSTSTVLVSVSREPQEVLLAVEDEGPGILPQHRQRVFDPFFTTRASGSGLGLPLVKRVVEAHGGTVRVGEKSGRGARLEFRIPPADPLMPSVTKVPALQSHSRD